MVLIQRTTVIKASADSKIDDLLDVDIDSLVDDVSASVQLSLLEVIARA